VPRPENLLNGQPVLTGNARRPRKLKVGRQSKRSSLKPRLRGRQIRRLRMAQRQLTASEQLRQIE
jgi:hypothetical protein